MVMSQSLVEDLGVWGQQKKPRAAALCFFSSPAHLAHPAGGRQTGSHGALCQGDPLKSKL